MSSNDSKPESSQVVAIDWGDRWQVYHRLQALQIPCTCATNQPLQVSLISPTTAIQIWSVVKNISAPRQDLVHWLKSCWQMKTYSKES